MNNKTRVLIIPGNGCGGDIRPFNFYGWAEVALADTGHFTVVLPGPYGMPDPNGASRDVWLPHILGSMGCNEESVVVGHSSGAVAALRLAETNRVKGLVLVAAYDEDLGDEGERASGYFDTSFNWPTIMRNCGFIVQFAGARDSLVPAHVQRRVAKALEGSVEYIELPDGDHFFEPPFQQLVDVVLRNCVE